MEESHELLQKDLERIVAVVEALPERYRDHAFDLMVSDLLARRKPSGAKPPAEEPATDQGQRGPTLPTSVRAFLVRHGLTDDDLKKLALIEGQEVHFIREPVDRSKAVAQIQWSMLLALKSALLGQDFVVDPEAVRSICISKGVYDASNFTGTFKRSKGVFQKTPEPQGEPVALSADGQKQLADLIKKLLAD